MLLLLPILAPLAHAAEAPSGSVLGTVRDAGGEPVAGVPVVLTAGGVAIRRVTDASGGFSFPKLPPGGWELRAGGGEWQVVVLQLVPVMSGLVTVQDVTVAAAAPLPYVERPEAPEMTLKLPPRAAPHVEWARLESGLRVVVAADDDAPVGAIAVVLPSGAARDPHDRPGMARLAAELWQDTRIGDGGVTVGEAYHRLGAEASVRVTADHTVFLVEAPAASLPLLLQVEGARFAGALAGVTGAELARAARSPRHARHVGLLADGAGDVFAALYPESHPYHRVGREADLAEIDPEAVREWARQNWATEGSWLVLEGDVGDGEWVSPGLAWYGGWPEERGRGAQIAGVPRRSPPLPGPGASAPIGASPDAWVAWALPAAAPSPEHADPGALIAWATRRVADGVAAEFRGARCAALPGIEATTFACRVPAAGERRLRAGVRRAVRDAKGPDLARDLRAWQEQESLAALQSEGAPAGRRALDRATGAARTGVADDVALRLASTTITPAEVRALLDAWLDADRAVLLPVMPERAPER